MKQVSKAIKIFSLNFNYYLTQKGTFSKYLFVFLLSGFAIITSSFQKGNFSGDPQYSLGKAVPFEGKFTFSFGASGVSGIGIASHMGTFTLIEENNEEGFPVITGTAIMTGANGDQIFANHTGLVQIVGNGIADVNSEFTITGGTGRFTGATGSFQSQGSANLFLGTGSSTFEGTIRY